MTDSVQPYFGIVPLKRKYGSFASQSPQLGNSKTTRRTPSPFRRTPSPSLSEMQTGIDGVKQYRERIRFRYPQMKEDDLFFEAHGKVLSKKAARDFQALLDNQGSETSFQIDSLPSVHSSNKLGTGGLEDYAKRLVEEKGYSEIDSHILAWKQVLNKNSTKVSDWLEKNHSASSGVS